MVCSVEDILAEIDYIFMSYTYLYMETIQDLLDPTNDNLCIVEDPKSGDITFPGASLIEVRDQQSFLELLRLGEAHRFAANIKPNTESSHSHAILMLFWGLCCWGLRLLWSVSLPSGCRDIIMIGTIPLVTIERCNKIVIGLLEMFIGHHSSMEQSCNEKFANFEDEMFEGIRKMEN